MAPADNTAFLKIFIITRIANITGIWKRTCTERNIVPADSMASLQILRIARVANVRGIWTYIEMNMAPADNMAFLKIARITIFRELIFIFKKNLLLINLLLDLSIE